MQRLLLIVLLAICGAAYVRSEQPRVWNTWMEKAHAPESFKVAVSANAAGSPSSAVTSNDLPPISTDPSTFQTGTIVVHSAEDAAFLTQLNAQAADIDQKVAAMLARNGDAGKEAWDVLDYLIDDYQKKAASSPLTVNNAQIRACILLQRQDQVQVATNSPCDFGRHRVLVQQLLASPFPEAVALGREQAKPVDIQYTAIDGTNVDLANYRGKVVLVDFWAAWCGYCVDDVPLVVAAYNQYHSRGLEIVGVSWDDRQDLMQGFMNSHGMVWPQYYYGDHLGNPLSKKLGIGTLPALWLIDKHGCLVNASRGADLPAQVERVLAEQ